MSLSVLITTYNRADELRRCLDSLVKQTDQDFEVIVYDDGSQDNSEDVANEFKSQLDLKYIYGENFGGPARGRNVGIKEASREYVSFLDSDDWWYEDRVARIKKYFGQYDVIFHELDYQGKNFKVGDKTTNGREVTGNVYVDLLTKGNCLSNSATTLKKELVVHAGGVSELDELKAVEDYDLWLKVAKLSNKFLYIKDSLGAYWIGDDNISTASEKYISKITYLVNDHVKSLDKEDQKEAYAFLDYIIARNYQAMGRTDVKAQFFRVFLNSKRPVVKLKSLYCICSLFLKGIFK